MTIEEKYKQIEVITTQYIDGAITSQDMCNRVILITHHTLTTEEFFQR